MTGAWRDASCQPRPAAHALEQLAFWLGALFLRRPRGGVGPQAPQGPLNVGGDRLALLAGRRPLRGQDLQVLPQEIECLLHLTHRREGGLGSDGALEEFAEPLPLGGARGPGGAVDELARLRQGEVGAALRLVPLRY